MDSWDQNGTHDVSVSPEGPERTTTGSHGIESEDDQEGQKSAKDSQPPRKRQFAHRTKTGCHTCRKRKKKCDEGKPYCQNCIKGNFKCRGYGEKRPSEPLDATIRINLPLQSKETDHVSHDTISSRPRQSSNLAGWPDVSRPRPQFPYDGSLGNRREDTGRATWLSDCPMPVMGTRPPESAIMPVPDLFRDREPLRDVERERLESAARLGQAIAPASLKGRLGTSLPYPATNGHHANYRSGTSQRTQPPIESEKAKMLKGEAYRHFIDSELCNDRRLCRASLERYNRAARPTHGVSDSEIGRLFIEILTAKREDGMKGAVGSRVIVEAPFSCDYGYNIHIGDQVVVGENCKMQDPCKITIGDRTIIGPNVSFLGMGPALGAKTKEGNHGCVKGGPITIEEDCWIGGNVVILPNVVIKKGSVITPGTVVNSVSTGVSGVLLKS